MQLINNLFFFNNFFNLPFLRGLKLPKHPSIASIITGHVFVLFTCLILTGKNLVLMCGIRLWLVHVDLIALMGLNFEVWLALCWGESSTFRGKCVITWTGYERADRVPRAFKARRNRIIISYDGVLLSCANVNSYLLDHHFWLGGCYTRWLGAWVTELLASNLDRKIHAGFCNSYLLFLLVSWRITQIYLLIMLNFMPRHESWSQKNLGF